MQPRVGQRERRAASRASRGHQQARRRGRATANGIVESGRAEWRSERQVDRAREARCRARASGRGSAAGRAPRRRPRASRQARTGTSAPTTTDDHLRPPANGRRRASAIGIAARNDGSGSQTSNAGRGNDERRRLVAPERVGDEAAALDEVARDADVVGRVLGLREDDDRRRDDADDERDGEDASAGQPRPRGGSRRRPSRARSHVQRVAGSRQTGYTPTSSRRRAIGGPTQAAAARRRGSARAAGTVSSALEDQPADVVGARDLLDVSSGSLTSTTPPRPVQ